MSGTSAVFNACFAVTVGLEGGLANNPADPGGLTKYGISQKAYPTLDIADLTLLDAQAIYQRDYWAPSGAADCPPALACLVFDAAVNCGARQAAVWLQQAIGVTADGSIGPQTRAALARLTGDLTPLVALFHGARIAYMAGLSTWHTFGLGWSRRLAQLPYQAAQVAASVGNLAPLPPTTTA